MQPALRGSWLRLHRWVALALGWLLVLAGFLGALLTLARPLDQWSHPALFRDPVAPAVIASPSLDTVRLHLDRSFGDRASYTLRPPRAPGETLWAYVSGPWDGVVYFDAEGRELGRRGETEGAYNLLFELHSSLLLGDTGKAVLTTAAVTYLFLLATGLVLWWPRRWPPSFRIQWRAGALRSLLDLHNTAGALLGLLILVSVASGAYMAWPPLRTLVTTAAGGTPVAPPKLQAPAARSGSSLDALVRQAQARFPSGRVGYVQVPASATQPVRVRLKLPDDPHPNGLTSVWLDPAHGRVLRTVRWSELDPGNRLVSFAYPLHTGVLGGPLHEVLVGVTGLALATLGGSGLLLWWKRRRVPRARRTGAAAGQPNR
ncbi:PepSY-associated TM helix domain-containing protein [Ramlibacter sp.]|uniref:PepSY-associated TM helix domain-containing protein n=1 Tax=Ramlibacter sp. TaxID=1917967 RepID=UPI002D379CD7|nr:PepSY-associated TM helix domain-containing protein [Ramlibacter sp.]HYD77105.1 PepSY-associated TM helix domain-containing protein [Ramlibacter sp.]